MDWRKILMLVLNDVDKGLRCQTADFGERLLDACYGRVKEVEEAVVVKRDDADLFRDFPDFDNDSPSRARVTREDFDQWSDGLLLGCRI